MIKKMTKVFFVASLLVLAISILLATNWYIKYQVSTEKLTNQIDQHLSAQSDATAAFVNGWIEMHLKASRQNASTADMVSMDPAKQKPILESIAKEYKWLYLVFTIAPDGKNIARSDAESLKDYKDRLYFQQVMNGEPFGSQVIISKTTVQPALGLAVPILKADKIVGVFCLAAHITDLSENITNVKIGRTGFAFLLDNNGKVIAHQKKAYTEVMADFSKHPAYKEIGRLIKKKIIFFDDSRDKKVISYVQKTSQGWIVVVQQDLDEAYTPVTEASRNAFERLMSWR